MLIKIGEALKTINLEGTLPLVKFINDRVITVAKGGRLTVLNRNLEILESFSGTGSFVRTLTGNTKFIALGDSSGAVRYYTRGISLPQVSDFSEHGKLFTDLPS